MSEHFAIPATTFVLKAIIEARLKAAYGTFTPPKVSVEPPPRLPAPTNGNPTIEPAGLILYMHHAGANPAWRNMYDPHVDGSGKRFAKAPLVLDLQYMLAAQGLDLEREAVLGVGMSALHRNGIVPRPMIQQFLSTVVVPPHPTTLMESLTGEPLADPNNQPESMTISQQTVDVDMSTKLWSALQSPMRPCAYYLVTTVFLAPGEVFSDGKLVDSIVIAGRPVADPAADPADDDVVVTPWPGP
jgi:Pvc16 N-terminal domain